MTSRAIGDLVLDNSTFVRIRDFIYERAGLYFADNKKYILEHRISERLKVKNIKSFQDYYFFVKYDPEGDAELTALLDAITTKETSFFRDPAQLRAFEFGILPEIIRKNQATSQPKLAVWSAGCSTGEEPYTLSIIILRSLQERITKCSVEIFANDISASALRTAEAGIYGEYSLRNMSDHDKDRYFIKSNDGYHIREEVKRLVNFQRLNLVDDAQMSLVPPMDVIFCRNVLIYFNMDSRRKVVSRFYDILKPGGYLFIGYLESLHEIPHALKLLHFPGAMVYKKDRSWRSRI